MEGVRPPSPRGAVRTQVSIVLARRRILHADPQGQSISSTGSVTVVAAADDRVQDEAAGTLHDHVHPPSSRSAVVPSTFMLEADGIYYSDVHEQYSSMRMAFSVTEGSLHDSNDRKLLSAYHALIDFLWRISGEDLLGSITGTHASYHSSWVLRRVAAAYQVEVRPPEVSLKDMWLWLHKAASLYDIGLRLGVARPSAQYRHARVLADAVAQWAARRQLARDVPTTPSLALTETWAGDWACSDIYNKWPPQVAAELASFRWPITTVADFERLLLCRYASPEAIVGCEFTAAIRTAYECHHGYSKVAISVDQRHSTTPGVHAILDLRVVAHLKVWQDGWFFPPCTHHVRSDRDHLHNKLQDGRAFWTMAFFVFCSCIPVVRRTIEQPNTIIPDLYISYNQSLRPVDVGDDDSKPIFLYTDGHGDVRLLDRAESDTDLVVRGCSGHKRLRDFVDSDARDRWRSSWLRFPHLSAAVVASHEESLPLMSPACSQRDYQTEIHLLAWACFMAGYYVPADYGNSDAQPSSMADRAYQAQRGQGCGKRRDGVRPRDLTGSSMTLMNHTDGAQVALNPQHHRPRAASTFPTQTMPQHEPV